MNTEQATEGRRVFRRYTAEDRDRLIREHAASGMTKKAFCAERGMHVSTFHWWLKVRKQAVRPQFAEVAVKRKVPPVEIELPGGRRFGLYINDQESVVRLIRGVLSC